MALRNLINQEKNLGLFLILFHIVGIVGFSMLWSRALFLELTKWTLVMSFSLIFIFHKNKISTLHFIVFFSIFISAFTIELIGVQTGLIFGSYTYGAGLGLKLFETPLLIGLNWLALSYGFVSLSNSLKASTTIKVFLGSLGMLLYDLIMEQVAPTLDLWIFENNIIPLNNYLSWFILALIFQLVLHKSTAVKKNHIANMVIICELGFFFILYLLFNFIL